MITKTRMILPGTPSQIIRNLILTTSIQQNTPLIPVKTRIVYLGLARLRFDVRIKVRNFENYRKYPTFIRVRILLFQNSVILAVFGGLRLTLLLCGHTKSTMAVFLLTSVLIPSISRTSDQFITLLIMMHHMINI